MFDSIYRGRKSHDLVPLKGHFHTPLFAQNNLPGSLMNMLKRFCDFFAIISLIANSKFVYPRSQKQTLENSSAKEKGGV